MRVLITGGAGLIGRHFVRYLVGQGHAVTVVDPAAEHLNQQSHEHSWTIQEWRARECQQCALPFDVIIHLAAKVGVPTILADPLAMLTEHMEDDLEIVCLARCCNATLLAASSSEVYGRPTLDTADEPQVMSETDESSLGPSAEPRWGYAVSKLLLEHLCLAAHRQRGLRVVIPRLFNVVGPGQRTDFVIPRFVEQALSGQPITLHGDGSQIRTFADVRQVVPVLWSLIEQARSGDLPEPVINVGTSRPWTMAELADAVLIVTGRTDLSVRRIPWPQVAGSYEAFSCRVPDLTRLHAQGLSVDSDLQMIVRDVAEDMEQRTCPSCIAEGI